MGRYREIWGDVGRCEGAPAGAVDALAVGDALRILAVRGAGQRLAAVGPCEARVAEALGPVADAAPAALARVRVRVRVRVR